MAMLNPFPSDTAAAPARPGRRALLTTAAALAAAPWLPATAQTPATGVVRIATNGTELLRDCAPWYPRGMSLFGRVIPRGWKTDNATLAAQRDFGPRVLEGLRWMGVDLVRFQVGMPFLDPESPQRNAGYLDEIRDAVALARRQGFSVLLSMQWQERTNVDPVEKMPGASALRAWRVLAPAFINDLGVMHELFNEPISPRDPTPAMWEDWRRGHQALIDEVRRLGARNVLWVNGMNQAKILEGAPALRDPLNQIGYAIHPRLWGYLNSPREWDERFGRFAERHVVMATEWSHGDKFCKYADGPVVEEFLRYLEKRRIGLVGWGIDIPGSTLLRARAGGGWEVSTFEGRSCESREGGPGELMKRLFERNPPGAARPDASCPR